MHKVGGHGHGDALMFLRKGSLSTSRLKGQLSRLLKLE